MGTFGSRLRSFARAYPELLSVLAAAAVGLSVRGPLALLASHQGIEVLLAVLVFATALGIEPADFRRLGGAWRPLLAAVATGIVVLPALSWVASRLVAAGPLRDGVMVAGLAPCEIASVATTAMAGGEAALSAGVLIGSTMATVLLAGPVLAFEAGHVRIHAAGIIANLALVVAFPLAAGLLGRELRPLGDRGERRANLTAISSLAGLVALVAAEVRLSVPYLRVVAAFVAFVAASGTVGRLLGTGSPRRARRALLLTTSMRDFAIAADLAVAAFGPSAAAPLGAYGILVLVWGTAAAGVLRKGGQEDPPPSDSG